MLSDRAPDLVVCNRLARWRPKAAASLPSCWRCSSRHPGADGGRHALRRGLAALRRRAAVSPPADPRPGRPGSTASCSSARRGGARDHRHLSARHDARGSPVRAGAGPAQRQPVLHEARDLRMGGLPYRLVNSGDVLQGAQAQAALHRRRRHARRGHELHHRLSEGAATAIRWTHLSPFERAQATAFQRLFERTLLGADPMRWAEAAGWALHARPCFGTLPALLRWVLPVARRGVLAELRGARYRPARAARSRPSAAAT